MAKTFRLTNNDPNNLTKRAKTLIYLAINGESSKSDIILDVWGKQTIYIKDRHTKRLINLERGWASTTFSEMHKDGRLVYNPKTKKWGLGKNGEAFVQKIVTK